MGNTIDVSSFSSEIGTILSRYSKNVANETEKWLQQTAKKTAKKVKALAPANAPADYRAGIRAKKVDGRWVVYASKKTGLAHLMEKPHVVISHGVIVKLKSRSTPHWKPAEEAIQDEVKELEKNLEKIGG